MISSVFPFASVPRGWREVSVGELCDASGGTVQTGPFGSQLHASDYKPVGTPVIMPKNLGKNTVVDTDIARIGQEDVERLSRHLLETGDVIFPRRGDISRFAYIDERHAGWFCGTGCLRIRLGGSDADPVFLSYYLSHPAVQDWIVRNAVGTTMLNLSTSIIRALPVLLPPLSEQQHIAHVLRTFDWKIDLNRQMNQTLEAIVGAIFKSWFVDFDPVWTKAEGEQPYGMDAETAALFPDTFVDSELGPIPEGWNVHTIGNLLELAYGKGLKAADRRPGSVPVYGSNGQVGWHDERLVDGPGIIVGRKGNPGTVTWSQTDFFPIDTTFYVVPHGPVNSLTYLFNALGLQNLPSLSSDSAVPGLNRNIACMSHMLVPPSSIVQCFDDSVRPLQLKVWSNQEENHTLAELRDTLLPKLISGELRVPEASELVEEEL